MKFTASFVVLAAPAFAAHSQHSTVLESAQDVRSSYDYIVAGGGTSGLTVANRLTEDPEVNVLVIEYGYLDDGSPGTLVPGLETPQKYWHTYTSVPQRELYNRTSSLYLGEVVGGGTVINGMFFNRGSAEDYDAWEELGNPGWGWKGLLAYFKKSETYTPATPELQKEYPISPDFEPHGKNGPVGSNYPPFQFAIMKHAFKAWESLGVLLNPQSNAGLAIGMLHSPVSMMHRNMSRSSASAAYYKPVKDRRPNLHLLTGHRVGKVVFDGKRACRVEFFSRNRSGTTHQVKASREVILAAGAIKTPQILQLSGIGPKSLLISHGIPVLADLPVGYNFQDQPSYYIPLEYKNWTQPIPDWLDTETGNHTAYAKKQLDLYYKKREGPYTIPYQSGCDVAFLPLRNVTKNFKRIINNAKQVNLAQTQPRNTPSSVLKGHAAQIRILLRHLASPNTAAHESPFNGSPLIIIVALKPFSRGSIQITSTSPMDSPRIDFGTFTHRTDLDILTAALHRNREFLASPPMQEIGATELFPGAGVSTDEQIAAALRNGTESSWQHPVGTTPMMPKELGGVVDGELRVYGVKGLRIVDASVMPIIPASHTSSTVYAVAEKAADLIKASQKGETVSGR